MLDEVTLKLFQPSKLLVDLPEIDLLVMGIQYEEVQQFYDGIGIECACTNWKRKRKELWWQVYAGVSGRVIVGVMGMVEKEQERGDEGWPSGSGVVGGSDVEW
nr:hypothetical protein [Tanacetum cinerariifolium]